MPSNPMSRSVAKRFLEAAAFYLYNHCVTGIPWYRIRHLYLRRVFGIKVEAGAAVHMGCFFTGRNISIGRNSVINRNCRLDGRVALRIGENVSVSPECCFITLDHDPNSPTFAVVPGPVSVGDFAWIGARAIILPGVTLGRGVVVGAGAVVTKSQDDFSIVAGVPAKRIGERARELDYQLDYFPFFDTDVA